MEKDLIKKVNEFEKKRESLRKKIIKYLKTVQLDLSCLSDDDAYYVFKDNEEICLKTIYGKSETFVSDEGTTYSFKYCTANLLIQVFNCVVDYKKRFRGGIA